MTTPTILILGGTDKGNDYSEIDQLVKEKCSSLIFMGKDNSKLIAHFEPMGVPFVSVDSLEAAVQTAYNTAQEGETVLLSPCCASFDLFKNYEDRGHQFMQTVRNL
jgi:UDP-N-acetylmuramoylalanine--D-glutamate ligase